MLQLKVYSSIVGDDSHTSLNTSNTYRSSGCLLNGNQTASYTKAVCVGSGYDSQTSTLVYVKITAIIKLHSAEQEYVTQHNTTHAVLTERYNSE